LTTKPAWRDGLLAVPLPPARRGHRSRSGHLRFDRADATEVEVTFTPIAEGRQVRIEHRGWERLGAVGEERRDRNRHGWAGVTEHYRRVAMSFGDGED
jgi:uncharacterized protein YndB with AHSA1/START domain